HCDSLVSAHRDSTDGIPSVAGLYAQAPRAGNIGKGMRSCKLTAMVCAIVSIPITNLRILFVLHLSVIHSPRQSKFRWRTISCRLSSIAYLLAPTYMA